MKRTAFSPKTKFRNLQFPLVVEKDKDGFYVVECPIFEGCYAQGKTLDEALKNIREVIQLVLEEKKNQEILKSYRPQEMSLHKLATAKSVSAVAIFV